MYAREYANRVEKRLQRLQWVAVSTAILLLLGMFAIVFGGVF